MRKRNFTNDVEGHSDTYAAEPSWQCNAHGCKLPGGLSTSGGDGAKYYCKFHYGKHYSENDAITTVLQAYYPLFDAMYAIHGPDAARHVGAFLAERGFPQFQPTREETVMYHWYKARLHRELNSMATEAVKKAKQEHDARNRPALGN